MGIARTLARPGMARLTAAPLCPGMARRRPAPTMALPTAAQPVCGTRRD